MLILPVFVAGNKGWFETKPPCQDVTHGAGERATEHGAWQVPTHMTNHGILQKISTILGALLLFCTFHCLQKTRRRIMMRHTMGIICMFFPEEMSPDLKPNEVNSKVVSSPWITPPALMSQLTEALCTKNALSPLSFWCPCAQGC